MGIDIVRDDEDFEDLDDEDGDDGDDNEDDESDDEKDKKKVLKSLIINYRLNNERSQETVKEKEKQVRRLIANNNESLKIV